MTKAPVLSGPKRHHYVPRFYLRSFAGTDECLALYDRSTAQFDRRKPETVTVEGHFYTIKDEEGRKRFEIENALSKIEADASNVLPKLLRGDPLSEGDRFHFAYFVATQVVRTPAMIQSIQSAQAQLIRRASEIALSDPNWAYLSVKQQPEHADKSEAELRLFAQRLTQFTLEGEYSIEVDQEFAVAESIQLADTVAPLLLRRDWQVLSAPRLKGFITSDAPVLLTSTDLGRAATRMPVGFGSAHALIALPLSPDRLLVMSGNLGRYGTGELAPRFIKFFNQALALRSVRFILCRDDALLRSVTRHSQISRATWKPTMQVG